MTEAAAVSIEQVRTLVAERQRYDDWLTALEARRAETPMRVFERVQGDYVNRRDAVVAQLGEHVDALGTLANDLDERVSRVEAQLTTREDERAEAMLRTAVGEFDSERWEVTRQEVEAAILELKGEREGLLAEVDDVRTLLASARQLPAIPEPEVVLTEVVAVAPHANGDQHAGVNHGESLQAATLPEVLEPIESLEVTHIHSAAASTQSEVQGQYDAAPPSHTSSSSEVADQLHSNDIVVGASFNAEPIAADVIAAPVEGLRIERERTRDSDADAAVDALGTMDVFGAAGTAPARGPSSSGTERRDSDASTGTRSGTASSGTATRDGFDDLAFLRSVIEPGSSSTGSARAGSGEQTKTLRCTECGTMNFPTEWYCERCGGELAAF